MCTDDTRVLFPPNLSKLALRGLTYSRASPNAPRRVCCELSGLRLERNMGALLGWAPGVREARLPRSVRRVRPESFRKEGEVEESPSVVLAGFAEEYEP